MASAYRSSNGSGDEQYQSGEQVGQGSLGRNTDDHTSQCAPDEKLLEGDGQQAQRAQEHYDIAHEQKQHLGRGGRANAGVAGCAGHFISDAAYGDDTEKREDDRQADGDQLRSLRPERA